MTSFAILAALMLLAAVLLLIRPLLSTPRDNKVERRQINLDIYRQRLAELDNDLAQGQIDKAEYQEAQQDLEKQLIVDIPEQAAANEAFDNGRSQASLITILIAVPAVAVGLYLYLGNPSAIDNPAAVRQVASPHEGSGTTPQQLPSVEEMIAKLEERLQQQPDDAKGWYLLSRSYMHTQQFDKAEKALEKLSQLAPNDANTWANYADIVGVNEKGRLNDRAYEYIKRALSIEPKHLKALWLAGTYHYQQQSYGKAIRFWQIMRQELPPDSRDYEMISASIADAQKRAGITPETQTAQQAPAQQSSPPATAAATAASISGKVTLADALRAQVSPTDTVFVYARAASGPRMPLAIVRKQVADLPFEFTLDDSMAMMPQMKLSNFDRVVVSARISKTGNAMPQSGDLISEQPEVGVKDKASLSLEIQSQLP